MKREERLKAWFSGELDDDDLTQAEIADLQERVYNAITKKILERDGTHTFPQHGTMQ